MKFRLRTAMETLLYHKAFLTYRLGPPSGFFSPFTTQALGAKLAETVQKYSPSSCQSTLHKTTFLYLK